MSTAEWTGVLLTEVLDRAGVQATAQEVLFRGADRGQVDGHGERVYFERSMPVDLAGHAGALLAYAMNGEELPAQHGYPLRLVVPGWYTVASVKWLTAIELIARPFRGHFQADRFHINGEPLSLQRVRSLIIEPAPGATAGPGDITIRGVAWSGAAPIAQVEVSIDGAPWRPATLVGEPAGTAGSGGSCQFDSLVPATSPSGPRPQTWPGRPSQTSRSGIRSATPTTPSTKSIFAAAAAIWCERPPDSSQMAS